MTFWIGMKQMHLGNRLGHCIGDKNETSAFVTNNANAFGTKTWLMNLG